MVKSVPMRDHKVVIQPKRRSNAGAVLLLIVMLLAAAGAFGAGFFAPTSLSYTQEQLLGLVHGGIAASDERTFVDGCAQVAGFEGLQAVTRTIRTTTFRDGTALTITFTSRPTPTITQCQG